MGTGTGKLIGNFTPLPISADDIEIEKLAPGEIIKIFPKGDATDLVETIIKSLYFMQYAQSFEAETDKMMKEKELPEWLIMAFTETKRLFKKSLQDAERNSFDFLAKLEVQIYGLAILLVLVVGFVFLEADALRNDKQEILFELDNFNRTITLNPQYATEDRIESIKEVIFSQKVLSIDDNIMHKGPVGVFTDYYLGWELALNQVQETKLTFDLSSSPGDISINLFKFKSDVSGRTQFFADRAVITIYDVDSYTPNSLKSLVRHELGHAFGLGHTTAKEELMNERINLYYPYISSCNIAALSQNHMTEIRCEK